MSMRPIVVTSICPMLHDVSIDRVSRDAASRAGMQRASRAVASGFVRRRGNMPPNRLE
jgi:hypothetical protein